MSKSKQQKQRKKWRRKQKKKCFVVGAIGSPNSRTRVRADSVRRDIVQVALNTSTLSFAVERIDSKGGAGDINEGIVDSLRTADLVVVDLTDLNPNAMNEMGIRQAWNLPLIPIIAAEHLDELPFDVKVLATVPYSLKNKKAKQRAIVGIRKQLKSILRGERTNAVFAKAMSYVGKEFSMDSVYASFRDALTDAYRAAFDYKHELPHTFEIGAKDPQTLGSFAAALRRVFERMSDKLYVFSQIAGGRPGEYTDDRLLCLIERSSKVLKKANQIDRLLTKGKPTGATKDRVMQLLDSSIEIIDQIARGTPNREE